MTNLTVTQQIINAPISTCYPCFNLVVPSVVTEFTQADLDVSNILTITHDFGRYPHNIIVYDENNTVTGVPTIADEVEVTLDLNDPITGTWRAIIT